MKKRQNHHFEVRSLAEGEYSAALELAWSVFSAYEAPGYSPEGVEEFHKCLHDDAYLHGIVYYGAFDGEKIIGMLGIRKEAGHFCFFFVDGCYHRMGIGTRLFYRMREDFAGKTMSVNSSLYAVPFYQSLGFTATDCEQTVNGIRFMPMILKGESLDNPNCPCKRKKCPRHGNCEACRKHHAESKRQRPCTCE